MSPTYIWTYMYRERGYPTHVEEGEGYLSSASLIAFEGEDCPEAEDPGVGGGEGGEEGIKEEEEARDDQRHLAAEPV
jgi:hypothetical protein